MSDDPPWLSGLIPFPAIDDWLADAALCVRQNLRARETTSASCRSIVEHLGVLPVEELLSTLLRPEVFVFLTAPHADAWTELRDALGARSTRRGGDSLIWSRPTPQFAHILRCQGRGSRRDSCASANFIDPLSPHLPDTPPLEQALFPIGRVTPGFRAEIDNLVDCVVLVDEGRVVAPPGSPSAA